MRHRVEHGSNVMPGCAAEPRACGNRTGDLQDTADRLDPETVTMLIDKCPQDLVRRSSSAWAKYALARRRIRWLCAARGSRAPGPLCARALRWSDQGADRHRSAGGESSHAGFALRSRFSAQWPQWPPTRRGSRSGVPEPCAQHVHGLRGVGRSLSHGLIFSRVGASTKPGRFNRCLRRDLWCPYVRPARKSSAASEFYAKDKSVQLAKAAIKSSLTPAQKTSLQELSGTTRGAEAELKKTRVPKKRVSYGDLMEGHKRSANSGKRNGDTSKGEQ